MMHEAWIFFAREYVELSAQSTAAFFAYVGALLAAFIKSIDKTMSYTTPKDKL